jgi:hypothetical protein
VTCHHARNKSLACIATWRTTYLSHRFGATPRHSRKNAQLFIGVATAVAAAPATPHLSDGYERTCLGNGAYDEMLKTFTHAELERQQRADAAAERKLAPRTERCDADQC